MTDALAIDEAPKSKITTAGLSSLLREKFERNRYALLFDVPDAVSLDQRRRIDAIAVDCWASGGRTIQGFELKVSRSDWLRELKQVDKADPFVALCDYFWLVTGDTKIAKLDEVPACWGWMAATKSGLRVQRPALKLPGCGSTIPRAFMIGVLRKLQDALLNSPDVQAHISQEVKEKTSHLDDRVKWETKRLQDELERQAAAIKEFEESSGLAFRAYGMGSIGAIVGQLKRLGYGEDGGLREVSTLLDQQANALQRTLEHINEVRINLAATPCRPVEEKLA